MKLLKSDTQCKMSAWIKNLNAQNVRAKNESKADSTIKNSDICAKNAATRRISDEKQYSCIWKKMVLGGSKEFLKSAMFLS